MSMLIERVEIDFMLLADRAEVLNGKLYMMGGAWDRRYISNIEAPVGISIAIGVLVPWNLTNEPHQIEIRIEDEDGNVLSPRPQITLNVGRPTQATKGQTFRAMAVVGARWTLPKLGTYCVVASIAGEDSKRVNFYADAANVPGTPPSNPGNPPGH